MGRQKEVIILLPYLGLQSNQISKRLKSCIYQIYSCVNLKIINFFETLAVLNISFHVRTTLIALKDPKSFTELVVGIVMIFTLVKQSDGSMIARLNTSSPSQKNDHSSTIAVHITATGHNIKQDHFEILASGKTDYHCKIKETLFIQDLS